MKKVACVLVCVLAGLVSTGCSGGTRTDSRPSPSSAPVTISGAVVIKALTGTSINIGMRGTAQGVICGGAGSVRGFGSGGDVVVKNANGSVVGTTTMSGQLEGEGSDQTCVLSFSLTAPASTFYTLEAGGRTKTIDASTASNIRWMLP